MKDKIKPVNSSVQIIDTLIIVGNGFDIWQGIKTNYSEFHKYYLSHRDEILKKLHLKKRYYIDEKGKRFPITDVELIYGDPYQPNELDMGFWNRFESSLDKLDSERINYFFGKKNKQLYKMQKCIENAQKILREAFVGWISTIEIESKISGYKFGHNCFCVNFNYTDTLAKRFGVVNECHIHGSVEDGEDIIFGHSEHPQRATYELAQLGGRFLGLYLIEEALYETDKHVHENIQFLRLDMDSANVQLDKIKNIYVLGHSFGSADVGYFKYFFDETSVKGTSNRKRKKPKWIDTLEETHLRMQYAIHRYGERSFVSKEEATAVQRRFEFEKVYDEEDILSDFYPYCPGLRYVGKCNEDALWHISYYSDEDKIRIEEVMKKLGCTKYELFSSIEECIKTFKN